MRRVVAVVVIFLCILTALGGCSGGFGGKKVGTEIKILFQNVWLDATYNNVTKDPGHYINVFNRGTEMTWEYRRPIMKKVLSSYKADSMGFTEVTWGQKAHLMEDFPDYLPFGERRYGDDYEGTASNELDLILYNPKVFTLDEQLSATYWLSDTPGVKGSKADGGGVNPVTLVAACLVHNKTGERIMHYNTHFSHDSAISRARQGAVMAEIAEEFLESYPGMPIYATGDYNTTAYSEPYNAINALLNDAMHVAIDTKSSTSQMNTFPAMDSINELFMVTSTSRIDYCFVNDENMIIDLFEVIEKNVDGRYYSDHYGLFIKSRIYPK